MSFPSAEELSKALNGDPDSPEMGLYWLMEAEMLMDSLKEAGYLIVREKDLIISLEDK